MNGKKWVGSFSDVSSVPYQLLGGKEGVLEFVTSRTGNPKMNSWLVSELKINKYYLED